MSSYKTNKVLGLAILAASTSQSFAQTAAPAATTLEEITVVGQSVSYANNNVTEEMLRQHSALDNALDVIDSLPGVLINQGDTFGADDWSTTVSIRGFQLSLDEQQIGITIDGFANGNSNYGGGAKANRYIDTENLRGVTVYQGTADISSRSNEALGGTLDFTTIDPTQEHGLTASVSIGEYDAQKYYVRLDTGEISANTYAWISVSSSESSDWMQQAAQNSRDHFAAKLISDFDAVSLTAYVSYDDASEDNYQRISLDQFKENPEWDRLTDQWTGTPYVDQLYRRGWSTLRENLFTYLKLDTNIGGVDLSGSVYYHDNEGRGDWVPPYLVDITDDGDQANSELGGGAPVLGGPALGQLYFVDANGQALAPRPDCQSSITFPYGGAGPEYDPACYAPGAIPVGSYRHSHYAKERSGFNGDFSWTMSLGELENTLKGGIWYEDYQRDESRDWHKIIDSRSGYEYDHQPYWVQYKREYTVDTLMYYLDDSIDVGMFTAHLGAKQFDVELESKDMFDGSRTSISSDSDVLFSTGIVARMPIEGLELFAGYGENFAAIKDEVLERDASALGDIEPETAENIDVGLRYVADKIVAGITYYQIKFDNRLTFIAPDSPAGIDYLIGTNGSYINTGGIESEGFEASLTYYPTETFSVYTSYTKNESEYGDGSVDYPEGNTVFGSAEDMAVLSFDWANDRYFAGLSTKWVGDRWIDAANTQRADAYTLSNFYAGVALEELTSMQGLEARLTISNLFDEEYLGGIAGGSGAWLGTPRTAAINLSARF